MGLNSKQASWDVMSWSQQQDGGLDMPKAAGQAQNQQQKPPLRCPRCDSTNTKFCYYNNYSRSQPRHFCKACRRYWTEGGTLRNVPVGGSSKNKRQKLIHNTTTPNTISGSISNNPMLMNILHQVMMPYQPLNHSVNSNLLPIDIDSYDNTTRPLLVSSSSSYPSGYPSYRNYMIQQQITGENDLAVTNGVTATSTWREALALPTSGGMGSSSGYWSCWDDDITGLVDAELKQPAVDDPQRP